MANISRSKRLAYGCIISCLAIAFIELALHTVYIIARHRVFPFARYRSAVKSVAGGDSLLSDPDLQGGEITLWKAHEVIHPYFGFVQDPSRNPDVSYLGFPQKAGDPFAPCTNGLLVGICGGSFAQELSAQGHIEAALGGHGIQSRVVTLAMGGYKQPQQLVVLAWLLSHDSPIDVLVNIDGFNEVALPQAENLPKGVNPFYPRAWHRRTQGLNDRDSLRAIAQAVVVESKRQRWAQVFEGLFPWSISANVLWRARDRGLKQRIIEITRTLLTSKLNDNSFLTTGPEYSGSEEECYDCIALHWKSCSVLMKTLCDAREITYIHLLQPNQYHEAGRTLTPEEKIIAFREDHPYRPGVVRGYPRLIRLGGDLVSEGMDFHDLTSIYRDVPEHVYRDDCAHATRLGYEIVGQYVADVIARKHRQ